MLRQVTRRLASCALANDGRRIAMRTAITPMTTRSSTRVKAAELRLMLRMAKRCRGDACVAEKRPRRRRRPYKRS